MWDDDDVDDEVWEKKFEEWENRDWGTWLARNLKFPFTAMRVENDDESPFTPPNVHAPFRIDSEMKVVGLEGFDDYHEVFPVKVEQGRHKGCVPLCDLEVIQKNDPNYRTVREYVEWFANR